MGKSIRNAFDKNLSIDKLMKAHIDSRKSKGSRKEIILFNLKQEEYIKYLYEKLKDGTYKHGGYTSFYVYEPKKRKIEKSGYIDRIVHRWLEDNILKPYYLPRFIYTSYACIDKRGMHKACLDVQKGMRKMKRKYNNYYILKMDIAKFFQNIDKNILYNILKKDIQDKKVLWLIKEVIYSNVKDKECKKLNENKNKDKDQENIDTSVKSLPIGNYTSQIFANIYLNELDKYVKEELRCKFYYRYMDDEVVLLESKEKAIEILNKITLFLKEKLKLELNSKTQIFKNKQGVNFCGYKIKENKLKIREKGKRKLKKKIKYLKYMTRIGKMTCKEARKYLCGHIGYIQIADIHGLINNLFYLEG